MERSSCLCRRDPTRRGKAQEEIQEVILFYIYIYIVYSFFENKKKTMQAFQVPFAFSSSLFLQRSWLPS